MPILVVVVAAAIADDTATSPVVAVVPADDKNKYPVVKTTIVGESGTITDERPLPIAPVPVPTYVLGSRVLPYVFSPTVKIVPKPIAEIKSVKDLEDSESIEINSEPAGLPSPLVTFPYYGYPFGYQPTYPFFNGGRYFYKYYY